ncbi:fucolectin-1-like [Misgurnus anguillicaudatus]|uniref:fucolectin-1-like n=1 Tax=Misgurnus anguillicaudatus TaxID=75329 RepID=UPI003CCF8A32
MWMSGLLFVLLGMDVYYSQSDPSENLALRGEAVQSSTNQAWIAAWAIDSNPLTFTHTLQSDNPWWRLDLLDSYYISQVVITNRGDCCPDRLNKAEIHIGNSLENNGNNNPRCTVLNKIGQGQSVSVSCHNMKGRYVNVIIPGGSKILSLAEVEVYKKDYIGKTFVMIKFLSSVNVTDPAVSDTVLDQLKTALTSKGLSNVTLTWTKLPQKVEVKPEIKLVGPCVKEPEYPESTKVLFDEKDLV